MRPKKYTDEVKERLAKDANSKMSNKDLVEKYDMKSVENMSRQLNRMRNQGYIIRNRNAAGAKSVNMVKRKRKLSDGMIRDIVKMHKRGAGHEIIAQVWLIPKNQIQKAVKDYHQGKYDRIFNPREYYTRKWREQREKEMAN